MADREIKNIATVNIIEEASGEENLLVEANGLVRRLPSSNFSGGSGVGIDITGKFTIPEGGDSEDYTTWDFEMTCSSTFEKLQEIRQNRPIDAIILYPETMDGIISYNYMRVAADYSAAKDMLI